MAKRLITTIQMNLMLNPSEMWRRQHKSSGILVVFNFALSLTSQPFLAWILHLWPYCGSHTFYSRGVLGSSVTGLQYDVPPILLKVDNGISTYEEQNLYI